MGFVPGDLSAIPVHQLVPRRLHLGPFGSGRDLAKFLGLAAVGAVVAAVSSAVLWLPFLGIGALVAFFRVDGRSLDDYAVGYLRFRWRTAGSPDGSPGTSMPNQGPSRAVGGHAPSLRAGGIPIAYLPPADLQRLFEEWRSTLATVDRPLGVRMRGEPFSPLPFLPAASPRDAERPALDSYCELVRLLLRRRYRRVVEITVWDDPSGHGPRAIGLQAQLDELLSALERLGIPARGTLREGADDLPGVGAQP